MEDKTVVENGFGRRPILPPAPPGRPGDPGRPILPHTIDVHHEGNGGIVLEINGQRFPWHINDVKVNDGITKTVTITLPVQNNTFP